MAQRRLEPGPPSRSLSTQSSEEALDLLRPEWSDTLRGQCAEGFWLPPCTVCIFSEKPRPEKTKGVASSHSGLASLACDLCCPLGPTLSRAPTSALPVLKFPIVVEKEIPHFCFGSYLSLCSWSWVLCEMLVRRERFPPSLSSLPCQIHQQILLPFLPTCILTPCISFPFRSPPTPSPSSCIQEPDCIPIKLYL